MFPCSYLKVSYWFIVLNVEKLSYYHLPKRPSFLQCGSLRPFVERKLSGFDGVYLFGNTLAIHWSGWLDLSKSYGDFVTMSLQYNLGSL